MKTSLKMTLIAALFAVAMASGVKAQDQPYVIEYYYKTKWGAADEFLQLFKKNHLPVLKKQVESGRLLNIRIEKPRLHGTEDGRWDFRVTLTFKTGAAYLGPSGEAEIIKQLYPDQATFKREEQRRFELLIAHWDLPVIGVD
jgi:hypothetical protein